MTKKVEDVIHFPAPIVTHSSSKRPPVIIPTREEQHVLFAKHRNRSKELGFDEGAIVCYKYKAGYVPAMNCDNWGIVTGLIYAHADPALYRPIKVRWLTKNRPDEAFWPDDLFLIHPPILEEDLRMELQIQWSSSC
jgi:hypothetical protein